MSKAKRARNLGISKKILLILSLIIIIAGMIIGLEPKIGTTIASLINGDIKEYDASNFIQDTFTQDNTRYVPIKLGSTDETVSKADVENEFRKAGVTVKGYSSDKIGTGTVVDTNYGKYTILIYGDTNGDGRVNILDAQRVVQHIVYGGNSTLTGAYKIAANVEKEKENEINVLDSARIIKFIVYGNSIIDSMPTSDIKNDHEKPVIKLNGEDTVRINVSTSAKPVEYKDQGAIAEDNVDHTVNSKIVTTSNVNVEKPGEYKVRYSVTDSNGNKADEVIRTVIVENYIAGIKIDTPPTKVDFAKGEEIKLDGIKVIAIMAYDDGQEVEIPADEIEVTPKVADTDKNDIDRQKVTLTYGDVSTTLNITVTPHVPIFKTSADFLDKVGLNDTYTAPIVTAEDDQDGTPLNVTVSMSATAPDGTTTDLGECTQSQISNLIDTSELGTKYTIKYTATNKLGNPNTLTKTITVVDVIRSVVFAADSELENKNYLNGDKISLKGISAIVNWRSGETTTLRYTKLIAYCEGSDEANIAKYNPNSIGASQTITVKYKTKNAVTGEDEEHIVGTLQIEVSKRLETVVNTKLPASVSEIYQDVCVARVKAGDGEEDIDKDKIDVDIKVKDGSTVTSDLEIKTWKENVIDENGNKCVDVYCVVTEPAVFDITITPYTTKLEGYTPIGTITPALVYLTSKIEAEPDAIRLSAPKIEGVTTQPIRYMTGDELVTNVTYYHTYTNNRFTPSSRQVKVPAVRYNDYNISVEFERVNSSNTTVLDTIDSSYLSYELFTGGEDPVNAATENGRVEKIKIRVLKDLNTIETDGTTVRTTMSVYRKGTDPADTKVSDQKPVVIYNEPKETLTFGELNKTNITLAMAKTTSPDYVVKQIDGLYYTMVPVSLRNQYQAGFELTNDMLTKAVSDGGIDVGHYDNNGNKTSLIKVIGVIGNGSVFSKAEEDQTINYIGIAPLNTITTSAELNKLINGEIRVNYGRTGKDRVDNYIETINVITPPVSKITVNNAGVNSIVCYTPTKIAEIKSATEINILQTGKLGIRVSDGARTYDIKTTGRPEETGNDVGFIEREKEGSKGTIELLFWSKKDMTYTITPYIKDVANSDGARITVDARHNTEVNLLVFNSKSETDYVGSTNGMAVPGGTDTWVNVRFYHRYDKNNIVPVNVKAKDISYEKLTNSVGGAWSIESVSNGSAGAIADSAIVDHVQISIGEDVKLGEDLEFNIKINNGSEYFTEKITIIVGSADKTTEVKVGSGQDNENMTIYQYLPAGSKLMPNTTDLYKLPNGDMVYSYKDIYYTLTPIKMNGTNTADKLVKEYMNEYEDSKDEENKISFIDQTNTGLFGENTIVMLGFIKDENGTITVAENDNDELAYVGIGISDENIKLLEDQLQGENTSVVLMKVNVYYTPEGKDKAEWQQRINISKYTGTR